MRFEPVIKWSGSKRNSSLAIVSLFPKEIDTYYEPFLGGGSITYQLLQSDVKVKNFVVSDKCEPLMGFWKMVQKDALFLQTYYRRRWNELQACGEDVYYTIRDGFNIMHWPEQLFFLSRTCYNGLIRFNKDGHFNSAFHYGRPGIHPNEMDHILDRWSIAVKDVKFSCCDFSEIKPQAQDFVYLDPPYFNSPEMYFGHFSHDKLFSWMSNLPCKYALSFDGKSNISDETYPVAKELYCRHEYIKGNGSSFLRLKKNLDVKVSESLYLNYENNV